MKNSLAILTSDIKLLDPILPAVEILLYSKELVDLVVFCDNINYTQKYNIAILPSFYMKFYKGNIIFLDYNDYLKYQHQIIGYPVLYRQEEFIGSLDPNTLSGCSVLIHSVSNNTITVNTYA
jgi:hypothetical protein